MLLVFRALLAQLVLLETLALLVGLARQASKESPVQALPVRQGRPEPLVA